ncbi:MAG: NTP transferase domain-containing protein [Dehalococcoidia bacterium]
MALAAIIIATARAPWSDAAIALLPWNDGQSLIEFHIAQLKAAGVRDIEVVLGHDAERVIPVVSGGDTEPIVNALWEHDAASSLRAGAAAVVRGTTAAFIVDVAEPRASAVLRALIDAHAEGDSDVTLPGFGGMHGTPLIMSDRALAALRNVRGNADQWSIVERFPDTTRVVAVESDQGLIRIGSLDDYHRAKRALGAG